jgi:hypothetical protein
MQFSSTSCLFIPLWSKYSPQHPVEKLLRNWITDLDPTWAGRTTQNKKVLTTMYIIQGISGFLLVIRRLVTSNDWAYIVNTVNTTILFDNHTTCFDHKRSSSGVTIHAHIYQTATLTYAHVHVSLKRLRQHKYPPNYIGYHWM